MVGASGSGKSTILKLIAKLEEPTSGEIQTTENIGMVFQLGALFPWLTVEENVVFGLIKHMEKDEKNNCNGFSLLGRVNTFGRQSWVYERRKTERYY